MGFGNMTTKGIKFKGLGIPDLAKSVYIEHHSALCSLTTETESMDSRCQGIACNKCVLNSAKNLKEYQAHLKMTS